MAQINTWKLENSRLTQAHAWNSARVGDQLMLVNINV
jgi:hypothetical protein